MDETTIWKIIESHYVDNPQSLVRHHIESYNDFYKNDIYKIVKERNPITLVSRLDERTGEYKSKCNIYIGGKNGDKLYFAKPVIYDNDPHYMFPNEARLRNMTYAMTIHYDMDIEVIDMLDENEEPRPIETEMGEETVDPNPPRKRFTNFKKGGNPLADRDLHPEDENEEKEYIQSDDFKTGGARAMTVNEATKRKEQIEKSIDRQHIQTRNYTLEKLFLGRFPVMVQSDFCILSGMPRQARYNVGECRNDKGGYFIIDGKEKTVVPQEKFGDNILRVGKSNIETILYTAEIKSVSENTSKPIRSLSMNLMAPTNSFTNMNIVVNIPNVRKPVPLFILFRALGVITDKEIITMCLLDLEKYDNLMDFFIPCIHDAGPINTQIHALQYIAELAKVKTTDNALHILTDYFLPHIGETNYVQKAYFLGYMAFKLISAYNGMEPPIDRDSFRYKRIDLVGTLLYQLFREYYKIQTKRVYVDFEKIMYRNRGLYESDMMGLIMTNYKMVLKERNVEDGFRKAFKGNWGAYAHTKQVGVVQDLNRLSFNSAMSHLRKTNLPMDSGSKLVEPRLLNGSQWGIFDPIDTPDGGNIGLHKHMSMFTYVTRSISREPMIKWLREEVSMKLVEECSYANLSASTKVFVNGYWAGNVDDAFVAVSKFKLFRRNGLIPQYVSISFDIRQNTVFIFTDGGRVCRPVFYYDDLTKKMSFETDALKEDFKWNDLLSGFNNKREEFKDKINYDKFYKLYQVYDGINAETNPLKIQRFIDKKGIIDYLDVNEEELAFVRLKSITNGEQPTKTAYTHCEIHESLIFGMMSNQIIYPQHNPAARNAFSCGQSKQAISMYHTNFSMRMDKTALILNQGQNPLVKSRYMEYINGEENYYGENVIVAIMCYTGYNVEDAILVNEGALKRGLFRTTYYSVYETHEEKDKSNGVVVEKKIMNIEKSPKKIIGVKTGYDYSKLDDFGLVQEGTEINENVVIIGSATSSTNDDYAIDHSKTTKKGQLGIVDKVFMTEGEEGTRIAKVRIREERIPAIGDKMASRSGQKGTIGQIIPERDMPFTKDGVRPDLIINPHAIPSRMTIGQLIECVVGKTCLFQGFHGDCTAFTSDGTHIGVFGKMLAKCGYHSSGNELLYNGMTGQQIESEIFFGPNYYMRLKHMVKDKVNYRALGPRTQLTRQPVGGRANDGGLRIGEMERDSIISHGAVAFLQDAMLTRGDVFHMAICNKTGAIAVYNPQDDLFISPMADGPLKFVDSLDGKTMNVEHITKYGRSFSIVKVPYVFKLLMQELQTINVKLCIITEDNINQFDNMNFSKNISLLTHGDAIEPFEVINMTERALKNLPAKKIQTGDEIPDIDKKIIEKTVVEIPEVMEAETSELYAPLRISAPDYGEEQPDISPTGAIKYAEEMKKFAERHGTLKIGDKVHFNGDFLRTRVWEVTNLNGNFATINTTDKTGLDDPEDMINVVQQTDLQKIEDLYPMSSMMGGYKKPDSAFMMNSMMDHMTNPMLNSSQQMMAAQMIGDANMVGALPIGALPVGGMNMPAQNPPININLVTGNNNKVTPSENSQQQQQQSDIFQSKPMIRMGGNSSANNIVNTVSDNVSDNDTNTLDTLGNGKKGFIVKKI
jgi:DNA-directed RNA polymerase II subunit RPB2